MEKRYNLPDLLEIMARLRAPEGGCPWDLKQTHESILNCLVEEAYEFIDAVENGDRANMREELGDLLLQVVFHAQMAREAGNFEFQDVVQAISEKLVHRHPHVFGEATVKDAEGVQRQWDRLKAEEKSRKGEITAGLGNLPKHLPALLKAEKIQKRASQAGFDWPDYRGALDKVGEELGELKAEIEATGQRPVAGAGKAGADRVESEFGDLLFAMVNLGRLLKLDPEQALARANRKFASRYAQAEKLAEAEGKAWQGLSLADMDAYWEKAKRAEAP